MIKINQDGLKKIIDEMMVERKERKFVEAIEL